MQGQGATSFDATRATVWSKIAGLALTCLEAGTVPDVSHAIRVNLPLGPNLVRLSGVVLASTHDKKANLLEARQDRTAASGTHYCYGVLQKETAAGFDPFSTRNVSSLRCPLQSVVLIT